MKNTKPFFVLLSIIFIALFISGCNAQTGKVVNESKDDFITLGAMAALTGPAAEYGEATQKGLDLAVQQINDAGGIKGKKINLIYEDDKCDPKTGVLAVQKLTSINNANIILGVVCSSVATSAAPIAQEQNLLIISSGTSTSAVSAFPNIFRTWPSDALQGKFLGDFVKNKLGLSRVGIIYMNNDYGTNLKDEFQKEFEKQGGVVADTEAISQDTTDVRTELIKLKKANPEAVFLATYARQMGFILKQANELGLSTQFVGGEGSKDPAVTEIGGAGAEGLIATVPSSPESGTRTHFLSAFKSKYNEEPGLTADSAYDIPFLLKIAMENCDNIYDVDCLKKELLKINQYEGASGTITFDENGDLKEKTYDLITVKNGEFVLWRG